MCLFSCSMDKIVTIWGVPAAFGMIKSLWDCEWNRWKHGWRSQIRSKERVGGEKNRF
jgi:hypothetical protein